MIKKILAISTFFLAFNACAEPAVDPTAVVVRQTINELMQKNNIPGVAVELYVDGKPHAYYFGYANRDKKTPVTAKTIFELGSITKVMTSLLLAQAVDMAKVQFSDSITNSMNYLPNEYEDITLLNLATHTSGLPTNFPENVKTQSQLIKYLDTFKPTYSADEQWIYSNVGIGMLGEALETVTHASFNQMYINQIMKPLKMEPIALTVPVKYKANYAQGYDKNGQPVPEMSLGVFPSAYGIKASAGDMQKFLAASIGLPGTPESIFYPMRMTQSPFVRLTDKMQGLGWQIHTLASENIADLLHAPDAMNLGPEKVEDIQEKPVFDGDALIDKTGMTNGFRAYIAVIPNKKTGIVILTNESIADGSIVDAGREILFKLADIKAAETQADEEDTN